LAYQVLSKGKPYSHTVAVTVVSRKAKTFKTHKCELLESIHTIL